jgi:hypothetical protein
MVVQIQPEAGQDFLQPNRKVIIMHDPAEGLDANVSEPVGPAPRGWPLLAWLVIVLAVAYILYREQPTQPTNEDQPAAKPTESFVLQFQARYIVGVGDMLGEQEKLYEQMASLDTGPAGQRLRFVTLAGELAGPEEALRKLDNLDREAAEKKLELTPDQVALKESLRRLYKNEVARKEKRPASKELTDAERQRLRTELGGSATWRWRRPEDRISRHGPPSWRLPRARWLWSSPLWWGY